MILVRQAHHERFPSASLAALIGLSLLLVGCARGAVPVQQPGAGEGQGSGPAAAAPQRTLVVIVRGELPSLAAKPLVPFSGSLDTPKRIFNGMLDHIDEREVAHPYLVESLPQLNTDTWHVFPDGRMETTHHLRPNLTWQDGTTLTADDFVFGWRVYAAPELGVARANPIRQMAEVVGPDARTVLIRWREAYPLAAEMDQSFQALPRHILEVPFQQMDPAGFANLTFWTFEYVGLGPYRVDRWEAGAFLEATAFDGHALGRPKIDRVRLAFIGDPNTAMANMLSGDAHFVAEPLLGYEEGATLEREWSARGGGGTVFFGLDRSERLQQLAEMERLINEDVGTIPHYFTVVVNAHTRNLAGPVVRMTSDAPLSSYQIQNWVWRE